MKKMFGQSGCLGFQSEVERLGLINVIFISCKIYII